MGDRRPETRPGPLRPPYTQTPMTTAPIARLSGVALRRPGSLVLREIDLTLEAGEAVAVFGPNGSGKTTLLRLLATLIRPTDGSGWVFGARLGTSEVEGVRRRIGLVGHEPALAAGLTLYENLRLVAELAVGRDGSDAARRALEVVGLAGSSSRLASRSSNGMKRRIEFARLHITRPDLLLLDEAHVGLDPDASRLVEHLVGGVTARGGAVVIVAHERERVRPIVDRAVTIVDGRLERESV
jgi:heme exporter protein A